MAALASTAAVTAMFDKLSVKSVGTSTFFKGESKLTLTIQQGAAPLPVRAPLTIEAAHKKGSGSTKNGRDSNSKRLGVKVYGDQAAKAGSIIVRQRGTRWHPGTNVGLGNDYTIYSKIDGIVKFEKFGADRKKISVYPVLEEKVENPNSRRVLRREAFRVRREKKREQKELDFDYGGTPLISIASIPEDEAVETVIG